METWSSPLSSFLKGVLEDHLSKVYKIVVSQNSGITSLYPCSFIKTQVWVKILFEKNRSWLLFWKIEIFWNRGGAKIFYFEKKLVSQGMAWSLDHRNWVGPQTHPANNTLANKIFTTIQADTQESLFFLLQKSFCLPSLLHYQTQLKQGYKKWGVTALPPLNRISSRDS
jgi:hypothetical protein